MFHKKANGAGNYEKLCYAKNKVRQGDVILIKQKNTTLRTVQILLGCFFIIAVVLPLIRMFTYIGRADIRDIFSKEIVRQAIGRSLLVSLTATAISVVLAMAIAWGMSRTSVPGKRIFRVLLLLPMLIPSISHGTGLILLFGSNGSITNLLRLNWNLYGFWGIVIGSVMYSFPVAFLMISDILDYEDYTPYEAAFVLGIPKSRRFLAITMPYLRRPMINVIFATFTLIVTDYGVPLVTGGTYKTLPVLMYEEVIGRLDFAEGSVFGTVLLIPAVIAFVIDLSCRSRESSSFVKRKFEPGRSPLRDTIFFIFLTVVSAAVCLPILSFAQITCAARYPRDMTFTLKNIESTIEKGAFVYLKNSLIIALCVAVIGCTVAFFCAYFTARMKSRTSSLLHLMSITSLAIPGIVLGLSYVLFFKGSFIYGTFAVLILVNIIHFFSSPYLMMYNSMGKLNVNLESVGATLGISRLRMMRDVFFPQVRSTLFEMFSYFFVNSMMTISAVAFLFTAKTMPLALMLNQFEKQTLLGSIAFVSLMILAVNLCMKGLISLLKKKLSKGGNSYAH